MKMRNKGKVHPFTSSTNTANKDALSVLKLLPAAIFTLISVLSLEDREVLAYMITRSMKTAANCPSIFGADEKRRNNNNPNKAPFLNGHKPMLDCECFECYTSFWERWNSSPNRMLIHQAIEAFEEHLSDGEQSKKNNGKNKKKEKTSRRKGGKSAQKLIDYPESELDSVASENQDLVPKETLQTVEPTPEKGNSPSPDRTEIESVEEVVSPPVAGRTAAAAEGHKGFARKVLPDVLGLFNSRLWSLWSTNV